jgi:hypothetical protein
MERQWWWPWFVRTCESGRISTYECWEVVCLHTLPACLPNQVVWNLLLRLKAGVASKRAVQADASCALAYDYVGQAVVEVYFLILVRILGNNAGSLGWVEWSLKAVPACLCICQSQGWREAYNLSCHCTISSLASHRSLSCREVAVAPPLCSDLFGVFFP